MTILDIVLLAILAILATVGFWVGFIRTLGHLAALIVGLLLSFHFYSPIAEWLQGSIGGSVNIYKVIVFIVLFGLVNRVTLFIFWLIEKVLLVPILNIANRLIGALLAIFGGVLILGLTLYFVSALPLFNSLNELVSASRVASFIIKASRLLWPLLPEALRQIPVLF